MADKKGANAMAAGIAGMAVGAAVGAAAVALRDPKTRKQAIKTIGELKKQTVTTVNQFKAQTLGETELPKKTGAKKTAPVKKEEITK